MRENTEGYRWIECGECGFAIDNWTVAVGGSGWMNASQAQFAARWNKLSQWDMGGRLMERS